MLYEHALRYANAVVNEEEITTAEVKTQCEWFLRDLRRQKEKDWPFYFDRDVSGRVERLLKLMNFATGLHVVGKSIYEGLEDFQAFFLANIFCWRYKEDRERYRYRETVLFIPRKNAKTFICAVIILILMLTEDEYSEFYSICLDRDLAGEVKKAISQIISASPCLRKHFKVPKTLSGRVECGITHSFYQPRTSQANSNNAIRPSAFIADECGAFTSTANIMAMKSGQLSVRNPLMFKLTTAYAEDHSIMLEELDYLKKIYSGLEYDERLFALLYYATEEHLWDDTGLYMANPLRIKENYDEIRDNRKKALAKPGERIEFLTKHVNHFMPSSAGEEFISLPRLRRCREEKVFDWSGRKVYVGLDLALSGDNVSVAMVTMVEEVLHARAWCFIPGGRIEEKNRMERTDYNRFIQEGDCFACGDEIISYGYVEDFVCSLEEVYGVEIVQIGYDRWNCISSAEKLEGAGYDTVEVRQHSSVLHAPTKLLQECILEQRFSYNGSRLYEINFQNARCVEDNNLNKYINKKKSTGKVDMVAATIDAVCVMQADLLSGEDFVVQT